MGATSIRLIMSSVVFFIAFPIVLMVTLMYHNSSFELFEGFFKGNVQGGGTNQGSKIGSLTSSTNASTPHSGMNIPDDKEKLLLDGLLASGFDEASCKSRQQSHLYRKASSHKPSPYLISKLRNYEQIHTRCGPNSRAYNKDMTKIIAQHSKNNNNNNNSVASSTAMLSCKYIIWTPTYGLGNQMISLASTFLYAILTNRVLLVKFGKDKHGLFCEPFLNSTWILPQNSPFWNEEMHVKTYQSVIDKDHMDNKANYTSKEDLDLPNFPSVLFVDLRYSPSYPERYFHCDHSQDLLKNVPLLIFESGQYFVPSLFMTPLFNKEIEKMFPEINTIFHHLGRYLFHPSNEAWGLISTFYQKHLAKANERIGLQIRVINPVSTPHQTVMNLVLNCTIQNKLLPQVLGVQNSVSSSGKNKTLKAVLVASLYPVYGENLSTMYVKKPTVTGEVIEVYQPSHEGQQKFNDNEHNMKAWVEMYLLSLCDVLVTTSHSTFGYVAQGLGNLRPWHLYKPRKNETHFPACEREVSFDPCYHAPPLHYCSGKHIKDFTSSFLHIRHCKDYPSGVKLVGN